MCHHQIETLAEIEMSYLWLEKPAVKDSMEALITAAQEQALNIRATEARAYQTPDMTPDAGCAKSRRI